MLQARLTSDGVFVNVNKVSLLHIDVEDRFEALYQRVEDRKLQQLVASETENILQIEGKRLNETGFIQREAIRNKQLAAAKADTVKAELSRQRQLVEANAKHEQERIAAESDREVRKIKATTTLIKTVSIRQLKTQTVTRISLANKTLAETARKNMMAVEQGEIERARSYETRDISIANIARTRKLENLETQSIEQVQHIFEIALEAKTVAQEKALQGKADAAEVQGTERAKTSEWVMLRETLGLSDEALANVLMYRALAKSKSATVTVDHEAVSMRLMEGGIPAGHSVVSAVPK